MSEVDILPPPEIEGSGPDAKWEREYREFLRLRPSLLPLYRGSFVAIHEGNVVESGQDQVTVALRAYAKHGYLPMYIGMVCDAPPPRLRVPSPRVPPRREA